MRFFSKVVEKDTEKEELITKVSSLQNELKTYKDYVKKLEEDVRNSPLSLDFDRLNVFSVERNFTSTNGGMEYPVTIVGYTRNNTFTDAKGIAHTNREVKEWYFHCSDERHKELVEAFNEYKKLYLSKRLY